MKKWENVRFSIVCQLINKTTFSQLHLKGMSEIYIIEGNTGKLGNMI